MCSHDGVSSYHGGHNTSLKMVSKKFPLFLHILDMMDLFGSSYKLFIECYVLVLSGKQSN